MLQISLQRKKRKMWNKGLPISPTKISWIAEYRHMNSQFSFEIAGLINVNDFFQTWNASLRFERFKTFANIFWYDFFKNRSLTLVHRYSISNRCCAGPGESKESYIAGISSPKTICLAVKEIFAILAVSFWFNSVTLL